MSETKYLDQLLYIESIVKERTTNPLTEPEAFIEWQGIKMISPGSIVSIQGKSGSHKSRLATEMIITLLSEHTSTPNALGMRKNVEQSIKIVNIDTERDTKYQFPLSIKTIIDQASSSNIDELLRCTSLIHLRRDQRRQAAKEFIEHIRSNYDGPLCVIIDVVSDISQDFNSVTETGEVLDQIKHWLNEYNCAVILILHENPGSSKMRGHLGTEILNKTTDAISIKLNEDDGIEIKFEKSRNYRRPSKINALYNDTTGRLETINQSHVPSNFKKFVDILKNAFGDSTQLSRQQIITASSSLDLSIDTIDNYLEKLKTINIQGVDYNLVKSKSGKETIFSIEPISNGNFQYSLN